jgi:hypothetical protein
MSSIKSSPNLLQTPAQFAFIKGCCITSNIIIAQEIAHTFRLSSWNQQGFILELDLAKAFVRINCPFIVRAFRRQGFHDHFINLTYNFIVIPDFSVLINGQV